MSKQDTFAKYVLETVAKIVDSAKNRIHFYRVNITDESVSQRVQAPLEARDKLYIKSGDHDVFITMKRNQRDPPESGFETHKIRMSLAEAYTKLETLAGHLGTFATYSGYRVCTTRA